MTSIELMIAAFRKLGRKHILQTLDNQNNQQFVYLSIPAEPYDSSDFLYDLTKGFKFIDNIKSMKSPQYQAQIDIVLSGGDEAEVCYDIHSESKDSILLAKDIECLCFLVVHEDINLAIEKYGERAVRLIPYGL